MADRVGQQLGNYRLLRSLGQGGFADVYLGEHIHLRTQAAIKVLRTQMTQQEQKDFLQEARTVAHLEHHNIVRLLDYGIENGVPFLVMSYAPHGTVRQRYPRGTTLLLPIIVSHVRQVASALQYAHNEHVVHRDVKPENMLIGRHNDILLSDFGIAVAAHSEQSLNTENIVGTPAYMAPEQFLGKPRPASDQYALGVAVYEWLCGERPFSQGDLGFQHNYVPPPSLREKMPNIPLAVEQVVIQALAKEPNQRFSSIQEFAFMFEAACQASQPSFSQKQNKALSPSRIQSLPKRRTIFATVLLLLSLLTVGVTLSPLVLGQLLKYPFVTQPASQKGSLTPTPTRVTQTMPSTQTSCPSDGKARAVVTAPLALGDHPTIVYVDNSSIYRINHPKSVLRNYDTITKQTNVILEEDQGNINEAQVSSDGRWIFFVATTANSHSALQAIRLDGQGLQTLYCTKGVIYSMVYSVPTIGSNYGWIAFTEDPLGSEGLKLLNTSDGTLKNLSATTLVGVPVTWDLSNELYVMGTQPGPGPYRNVYMLDPETLNVKTFIPISGYCLSFSVLPTAEQAFISQCQSSGGAGPGSLQSPSSISAIYNGSALQPIFTSSTLVIVSVSAISTDTLLLLVVGPSSQSGIWKMSTDGGHPVQLVHSTADEGVSLSENSYPWSVTSHDGAMYAFLNLDYQKGPTLFFGYLSKPGSITPFATIQDNTGSQGLAIVGWTTL